MNTEQDKEVELIIRSSKENRIAGFFCAGACVLLAFLQRGEGLLFGWLIVALIILRMVTVNNEILLLQPNGLTIRRGKKEKTYKWGEFHTRRVIKANGERGRSKYINFSKYKHIQGQAIPALFYQLISPYLIISISVGSEPIKLQEDGSFCGCVDENTIAEKLREWHVELEGDELGKPPWEEFL